MSLEEINSSFKVGLFCRYPFPNGLAATNRIRTYFNGLHLNGADCYVFILRPTENYTLIKDSFFGSVDGINYFYPFSKYYSKYKFVRVFSGFLHFIFIISIFLKNNFYKKFDVVFLSNDSLIILYSLVPILKFLKIKIVFISDEFPTPIRSSLKDKLPFWKMKSYKLIFKYVDGFIFMTEELNNFFNKLNRKPWFLLSTIINFSRFDKVPDKVPLFSNITYMGNMELSKDNVDNLIKAFSIVSAVYPNLRLQLYGFPSKADFIFLNNLIENLNLEGKVLLKGVINFDSVPIILKESCILVSSQPNTKRAAGGFPTKLGEYLASKIPTIITDVGEIRKYNPNNSYFSLVKPEDPNDFAKKILTVLENYEEYRLKALSGYSFAKEKFDNKFIGLELLSFLKNL